MVYKRINATKIQQKGKSIVITDATKTNQNELLAKSMVGCLPEEIPYASLSEI